MGGFWKSWLTVWWWGMVIASIGFTAAAIPGLDGPVLAFYDLIHWPFDGQSGFTEATRPTAAILGGVFLGFALAVGALMRLALRATREEAPAIWRTVTATVAAWYVADSAASVLTGVPVNALSNTLILVAYLIPVVGSGVLGDSSRPLSRSA